MSESYAYCVIDGADHHAAYGRDCETTHEPLDRLCGHFPVCLFLLSHVTRPYDGIPELLSELNAKGVKMSVAVCWGFRPAESLRASEPKYLVASVSELENVLI